MDLPQHMDRRRPATTGWAVAFSLIYATGCALSFHHGGDEYWFFYLGNLIGYPGVGLASLFGVNSIEGCFWLVLAMGSMVMAVLGSIFGGKRARVAPWLFVWAALAITVGVGAVRQHDTLEDAEQKHGSLTAYVVLGAMVSLSITSILAAIVAQPRTRHRRHPAPEGASSSASPSG
jgi:hypothetical protein